MGYLFTDPPCQGAGSSMRPARISRFFQHSFGFIAAVMFGLLTHAIMWLQAESVIYEH